MLMAQKVSQVQLDEDEFLSDLDQMRSKWTMRSKTAYSAAIKAVISEFTNPEHVEEEYYNHAPLRSNNNVVG